MSARSSSRAAVGVECVGEGGAHVVLRVDAMAGVVVRLAKARGQEEPKRCLWWWSQDARALRTAVAFERRVAAPALGREFLPEAQVIWLRGRVAAAVEGKGLARAATRVADATRLWLPAPATCEGPTLAVEIKLKAASGARSWLIDPDKAQLKATTSRLEIARAAKGKLHYQGHAQLWSDSMDDVRKALEETMQNTSE